MPHHRNSQLFTHRDLISAAGLAVLFVAGILAALHHGWLPPSPASQTVKTQVTQDFFGTGFAFFPPWRPVLGTPEIREETVPAPLFPDAPGAGLEMLSRLVVAYEPGEINAHIASLARRHGLAENLVKAVIRQESGFNPGAISPKGALGIMQLMPETAVLMGVSNPFDARQNIAGGVRFLKLCLDRFGQDVGLALAAYNAGPGNVEKYQGCPPFAETQAYVAAIMAGLFGREWPKHTKAVLPGAEPQPPALKVKEAGLLYKIPAPTPVVAPPRWKIARPAWKLPGASIHSSTDGARPADLPRSLARNP